MESTMVERKMAQREHEPIQRSGELRQVDIEDYIAAMVSCEALAAEKLRWSPQEWAAHCLHQAADIERAKLAEEKRKQKWSE